MAPWKDRPRMTAEEVVAAVRADIEAGGVQLSSPVWSSVVYEGRGVWQGTLSASVSYTTTARPASGPDVIVTIAQPPVPAEFRFDERTRTVEYRDPLDPTGWVPDFVVPTLAPPLPGKAPLTITPLPFTVTAPATTP